MVGRVIDRSPGLRPFDDARRVAEAPTATTPEAPGAASVAGAWGPRARAADSAQLARLKPVSQTSISAEFDFGPGGRMMKPGEELRLEIPEHLRTRTVRSVMLSHRQDPSFDTGLNPTTGRDAKPGLTAVNLRSIDDGTWRDWNCPWGSSGPKGAKFAEQRGSSNPEFENMYDWNSLGHKNADTNGDLTTKPLRTDEARVLSVGTDPVFVHKVIVNVLGEKPSEIRDVVFSSGTAFGDWEIGAGRKYGGGQSFEGTFPGALELGVSGGGAGAAKLPAGWRVRGSDLEIDLPVGKIITAVDVAGGDSHPDKVRNKDGGWGTPGWARISMAIAHADGKVERFVNGQGVPPEGVITGAPVQPNQVSQPGDKLVINGTNDTLYVMGVRIGFKTP
jgi:hypothetical protein